MRKRYKEKKSNISSGFQAQRKRRKMNLQRKNEGEERSRRKYAKPAVEQTKQ